MNPQTPDDSDAKTANPSGEASPPVTGYAWAPGAIALLEMRYWLAMIEHENLAAGREEALGGWLCDHSGAVNHYAAQFDEAKNRAQAQTHIEKAEPHREPRIETEQTNKPKREP